MVAGMDGFLGAHLAVAARGAGAIVRGVDLPGAAERGERVRASLGAAGLPLLEADLTGAGEWSRVIGEFEPAVVIHAAGSTRRGSTERDRAGVVAANLATTSALLQTLSGLPAAKRPVVVYPGSQMEYGLAPPPWREDAECRPVTPYAEAKLRATKLLLDASRSGAVRGCVARLPIVFGPGQPPTMFVPELIADGLAGRPFRMTEGLQRRCFVHAADAARFMIELATALRDGEAPPPLLNAPCSDPVSMREVAERTVRILDRPVALEIGALAPREGEPMDAWPDDGAARARGHSCRLTLYEGLRDTVCWYEANPWFGEDVA